MQPAEARALGALAGGAIAGVADRVAEVHRAVLARTPARRTGVGAVHEAIARPVYATVRGLSRAVAGAAGAGAGHARPVDAPSLADAPLGGAVLAALSGLHGDRVEREHPALAPRTELRAAGRAVPPEPAALAAAFPEAGPRLVVFVHGLCETEAVWRLFRRPGDPPTYGDRLRTDLGATPLYVRYNSGLPVAESARRLAALLAATTAAWPVPVEDVALVGHSLGGLVALGAAHEAARMQAPWLPALRHVVCLASPHHGAPLAKGAHAAAALLARVPETRAFARILELRSAATRDLRLGPGEEAGLVPGVSYCALSATVTRDPAHPAGRVAGDLLVRRASAAGGARRVPLTATHDLGGLSHFHVLNHPAVYERLRGWLMDVAPGGAPLH